MAMEMNLSLKQKLVMTQKMLLTIKVLQMSSVELENYLIGESLENPLIELDVPEVQQENTDFKEIERLHGSDSMDIQKHFPNRGDMQLMPLYSKRVGESLQEFLYHQMLDLDISVQIEHLMHYLIENLDENGYLNITKGQMLKELNCPEELLTSALSTLKKMDPPGVGAADLKECLLIQAGRLKSQSPILMELIETHLEHLSKNGLDKLARKMGISIDELKKAREELLALNPKPGNGFIKNDTIPFTSPDLFVVFTGESIGGSMGKPMDGGFKVIYNDANQPKLEINILYQNLIKHADSETTAYVKEKMARAKELITSINQRRTTVLNCSQAILNRQADYFKNGAGHLAPMTLADIAEDLGIHKSTVSRAISGKYLQSRWGVQCLSDFFSRNVSKTSEQKSYDMVLVQIKRIIEREDPHKPLSDQKIANQLELIGISISRRTVAKYRDHAKILPAGGRRRF